MPRGVSSEILKNDTVDCRSDSKVGFTKGKLNRRRTLDV